MLRYFSPVTSQEGEYTTYGDIGFAYFKALVSAHFNVRILALNAPQLTDKESRWYPYLDHFVRPVTDPYTNIVCGDNGELKRLFTVGVKNIAITAILPKPPNDDEVKALKRYDLVICPFEEDVKKLSALGILVFHVEPEDPELARFVREV